MAKCIRYLIRNNDFPKVVVILFVFSFALVFFGGQKIFLCPALSVFIGQSDSIL